MHTRLIKTRFVQPLTVIALGVALILLFVNCSDDESNPTTPNSELPEMHVSPLSITDTSTESEVNHDRTLVTVECVPHTLADFTFDCNYSWITMSNYEGTEEGITPDSFSVGFEVDTLPPGVYSGTIAVRSDEVANSPITIHITYTVEAQVPTLLVSPQVMIFDIASIDDADRPDTLVVACGNGSNAAYSISDPADWIQLTGVSGTTPDTVVVTVDPTQVPAGTYVDTLWVSSDEMLESPKMVVIHLTIPAWMAQTADPLYSPLLWDVRFKDAQTGWVVGCFEMGGTNTREGIVYGTTDGGRTWEEQLYLYQGSQDPLDRQGIAAIDITGQAVWVAGESGIIRRSQNNGLDWEPISTGLADTTVKLADIEFVTDQVGWIVGESGTILKTINGGDTWSPQTSGTSQALLSVSFIDELNGWVVGGEGTILGTQDGGDNWTSLSVGSDDYQGVFFTNASHGWVVDNFGAIKFTGDGGDTWQDQVSGVTGWLMSVIFINDLVGWIAGEDGVVLYTEDGGLTWTQQESNTAEWLHSIFFLDETTGWFVGSDGTIYHTTCGGNLGTD